MRISLVPDGVYESYRQITPELLQSKGICLLLSDLDFTLAPKSTPRPDAAVRQWIDGLRSAGVRVMILSNNRRPQRVETFCRDLGITYVGHAKKPQPAGFRRAMAQAGTDPTHRTALSYLVHQVRRSDADGCVYVESFGGGDALALVEPAGGARTPWQKVLHALQAPWKHLAGGIHRI